LIRAVISAAVRIGCNRVRQLLISAGVRSQLERLLWMKSERSDILFTSIVRRSRSNLSLPAASFNSPTNRIRTGAKKLGKKIKLAGIELDLTQTQFAQKSMPSIGFCIFSSVKKLLLPTVSQRKVIEFL